MVSKSNLKYKKFQDIIENITERENYENLSEKEGICDNPDTARSISNNELRKWAGKVRKKIYVAIFRLILDRETRIISLYASHHLNSDVTFFFIAARR